MKLIKSTNIFCNVADAKYSSSYGKFRVPIPVLPQEVGIIHKLSCKKIIIPYNWLKVVAGVSDTITITINGNVTTVTITEGNPNIVDLITFINSAQTKVLVAFNRMNSKISWNNQCTEQLTMTISTTATELLGLSSTITVPYGDTVYSQNIVDVRPSPIIQVKFANVATTSQEVYNNGQLKNTGVLIAIGMDVPLYGVKIYEDSDALYSTEITKEIREIAVRITDVNDNIIKPITSPYFTFCIDSYIDEEAELLQIQKEQLQLKKVGMLLQHTPSTK